MNQKLFLVFFVIVLLSGCIQATSIPIETLTATRTSFPDVIETPFPTETATPSITPLPTIPTFTPTLDVSTLHTVTPAAQAECPNIDQAVKPEDYLPEKLEYPSHPIADKILEFFNQGGDYQSLVSRLDQIYSKSEYSGGYAFLDVTGDQVPEFLYVELSYTERPIAFSCKNGKYEILDILSVTTNYDFYEIRIGDLNSDEIPEIIITGTGGVSFPISTVYLYEWTGRTFSVLGQVDILALRQTQIKDADSNGTKDIILIGDNPGCLSCSNFVPQRERSVIYGWNGNTFVEVSNELEFPKYRFQAIQDADAMTAIGKYDQAIQLYEETISNMRLEWWSPERMEYEQALSSSWIPDLTLPPEPSEDKSEYPSLAAYAYYRIMLLQFVQGNEQEANIVYSNLQQSLGNKEEAQPYIEMATRFLDAYQSHQEIYDGCAAAIQYAAEHPELLIPLGSDYHGWQSHPYVPENVCPFR